MTLRSTLGWLGQLLAWLVILAVAATLVVAVVIPRVGGATPYTILTGSMRPGMPPGTMVVAKPVDPERIGVGTVVTYQLHSGRPTVVTHRVVQVLANLDGELRFRTKGDANDTADVALVRPVQIKGERWYAAPYLGRVSRLLTGSERQVAVYVVAAGLLGYATVMFGGALRDRRRAES